METKLLVKYENLVYEISKKFYGIERDDLIQAGFLGLIKAYKNYDKTSNTKFSTYAYNYIYGEMYEVATKTKPIKVRKDLMKLYKRVLHTKELLTQKLEREVSYRETCKFLNLDYNLFNSILNSLNSVLSIENIELKLSKKERIDELILLKESLEALNNVERKVIKKRYIEDQSQTEIAKTLGLSQVKISRIEKQGKEKIRAFINS